MSSVGGGGDGSTGLLAGVLVGVPGAGAAAGGGAGFPGEPDDGELDGGPDGGPEGETLAADAVTICTTGGATFRTAIISVFAGQLIVTPPAVRSAGAVVSR